MAAENSTLFSEFVQFTSVAFSSSENFTRYAIAAGIAVGGILLVLALRRTVTTRLQIWIEKAGRYGRIDRRLGATVVKSLFALLPIIPVYWALDFLTLPKTLAKAVDFAFLLLFTFAIVRLLGNLAGFLLDTILRGHKEESGAGDGAGALMPIVRTIVWAIGLTFLLDNLGFQISSIVAGLGIVGVAVGLAGQAILADFFSYLVILMDKPFSLGDYISFGTRGGTVEHIGLKTTRLRATSGEIIIVPNGDIAKQNVNNFQRAERLHKVFNFGIAYETPVKLVKDVPQMIYQIAENLPLVGIDRVHFTTFGDSSLNFEVMFSILGTSFALQRDAQQALNIGIMERFEKEGIAFAYPTQTIHMAPTAGSAPTA